MENLVVMNHPLITHKMSILRSQTTSSKEFRELIKEITMLMCFESMKDAEMQEVEVQTPLMSMKTKVLFDKHMIFIPILRAGLGMVDGIMQMIPTARFGHMGFYRDHETLQPVEYYCKLPAGIENRDIVLLDPMLATGGTVIDAVSLIKKRNPRSIKFMCIVASPQGIEAVSKAHPDVKIFCAAKDEGLNEDGYILPGLGDAGDRIFGTK